MSSAGSEVQREFELSFAPKEPMGKGRGKVFEYSEQQFVELYKAAASVTGAERKKLCDAYHVGYQTLMKKAGVASPARPARKRAASAPRQLSVFEQIEALVDDVDSVIEQLDEEQQELRERIEEIEKKKALLQKVAALKRD